MPSACTLGPAYYGLRSVGALSPPTRFARASSGVSTEASMLDHWWMAPNDPTLDALEAEAPASNAELDAALARV